MSRRIELERTYTVLHGGSLHGMGTWSGPHASEREARASARECRRIVGGSPVIERSDGARLDEYDLWQTPAAACHCSRTRAPHFHAAKGGA